MFDYEIRYLWGRRFSMGGVLLALCRYLPFASILQLYLLLSTTDATPCLNGYRAIACIIYSEFLISVFVLFARAYAVWGRSRRILFFLSFIYAGALFGSSYSMVVFLIGLTEPKDDVIAHCLLELGNDDMWIAVVILVCCESLALGLLLYKSVQHARAMRNFANESSTQNLLAVMARDGIGYFFCTLANLIMIARVNSDLRDLLLVTQGAMQDILCSRLLIHIQVVNEFPDGMIFSSQSLSYNSSSLRSMRAQDIELADRRTWRAKITPQHFESTQ
ncbi:hypothetical protein SCHPADRAFT_947167 [Schizopora paradoxa]|uniref:Uncharacterized protein n=1 Tax=Schizopora paradoxa TaxID=27342 RepID=A0A0H2RJZ9_9AGAM|nr:hypothetical protein SCHPADRAFT_947167 [Schizopora paradoxa]